MSIFNLGLVPRKSRQKKSRTSIYSSKTNLNSLLEEDERIKVGICTKNYFI